MNRLLGLYPAAWRARYGDELAALLEDRPPSIADRLDIVRGAADAWIHPENHGREMPRAHRLPGLAALIAGLIWCSFAVGLALPFVPDPVLDGLGSLSLTAFLPAVISLPGVYLERYARHLTWGLGLGLALAATSLLTPWPAKAVVNLALVAFVLGGMLAMAATRAGVPSGPRWILVGLTLVPQAVVVLGLASLGFEPSGLEWRLHLGILAMPYAIAWTGVGLIMAARGAPTFEAPGGGRAPASEGLVR
jgi:hypothetical protein